MRGFKNFKGSDARCPSIHFLFYATSSLQKLEIVKQFTVAVQSGLSYSSMQWSKMWKHFGQVKLFVRRILTLETTSATFKYKPNIKVMHCFHGLREMKCES